MTSRHHGTTKLITKLIKSFCVYVVNCNNFNRDIGSNFSSVWISSCSLIGLFSPSLLLLKILVHKQDVNTLMDLSIVWGFFKFSLWNEQVRMPYCLKFNRLRAYFKHTWCWSICEDVEEYNTTKQLQEECLNCWKVCWMCAESPSQSHPAMPYLTVPLSVLLAQNHTLWSQRK